MEILVCISVVPDTTSKIKFKDDSTKFDDNGVTYIINPFDEFCLTKAIFIKENSGANITVLNIGESKNDPILRKALAIGADKAVRIDSSSSNSLTVAKQIAKFVSERNFDFIFCGKESIDYNGGKVPGYIAAILNLPFANACIGMEINGETIITKNEIDNGTQICESPKPLVIAGQKGLVEEKELRIPTMRGIMMARSKPLEVIGVENDTSNQHVLTSFELPEGKKECKMIDSENVSELVNLLKNEAKVL
ncbi:MAG: electron transfer flavoprotein subunit alpha [Flavobacteriales bacterium]|nr:electron transfer flavoprotein subunit alpha [Flavobacteriales bacterium]